MPSKIFEKKEPNTESYVSNRLKLNKNKFNVVSKNDILNYEHKINNDRLTTGLYAIMWALNKYKNVYIHGFDFFIHSKSHYYDSKLMNFINENILNKGHKHNNQKEHDFINNLIDTNKIKRLVKVND